MYLVYIANIGNEIKEHKDVVFLVGISMNISYGL